MNVFDWAFCAIAFAGLVVWFLAVAFVAMRMTVEILTVLSRF